MSTTTSTSTTSATTTADYLAAAAAPVSLAPPTLVSISDTGVKGDFITSATRPQFAAQLDVAFGGYTIALYDGDTKVGSAIVQTSGGWNIISSTLGNGAHNLRLALTDPAGNVVATSPTQQISIKTQAEAPSAPLLLPSVDSGASDSDHVTNVNVLRFSGSAEAGSAVSLYNGRTEVGSAVADASGKWVMDNVFLDDGSYQLTAVATDVARNISAPSASLNLVIDTEAPQALTLALAPASDSGHAGDGVTNVATPTVTGATEAGATVLLFDGATQLGSAVADAQGNWSIASATLADGAHQLAVRITDVAGNVSTAGATLAVTIDGAAPAAPGAPVLAAASDSGASNADQITNIATPRLGGMAEGGATIALYDGAQLVASTVAAAGGAWQIDDLRFADGAHSLTVKATDAAGNVSAASPALLLTVDTAVPAAPAGLDLLAGSDSGSSDQDNITNATLPVIAGTAEAGARVALYDGATLLGSGVADAAGQWQITVERALANGVHSLTAEATDAAGNVSPRSAALDVTIDTTAALPPTALDLVAAADSGAADGDDLTNVAAPVITGKAEAGARVALFDGDRELGSAVAGADGVWRITSAALADGEHHLTARSSSLTGTVSAPSEALVVTIDTAAPAAPEAPRLAAGADTGSSDSDHITNITTPALSGTAEAGATVTLFDGTRQVGTVVADASGAWRYTPEQRLENGEHSLTATATDAAGNISAASPALVFTIDSRAPAAPAALDLVAADDSGSAADDDITSVTRPAITGTAERGARVDLYDGDTLLGSAVAGDDGGWRIDVAQPLADGAHQLRAQATDVAGNTSVKSAVLAITVDTTVPTAPTELDLPTTADHGVSDSDDLTNAAAPTITGKADAGATVTLFDGDIRLGTAVADASGAWSINTGPLADGTHHLTASTSAKTGLVSAPSAALVVTIDTAAPATPGAPLLAAGDDSGLSNTDGVTNVAAPRLGGSAEAGASIALLDGGVQIATAVADANGAWSIGEHLFADGAHQLTVVATDAAGNVSAASQALTLTVDTGAPAAPSGLDLLAGSDGGVSNGDNITNVAQPTLAGQAAPLAAVALYDGATLIGSTIANAAGNWEITVGAALADGVHSLTATATDLAGNTSPASPALSVTVLTAPPATPSGLDLAGAADSGASNSDNLTNATTPLITGKAGANALVTVYDGATVVATTVADAAGLWSVTSAALADGAHHLSASAADVAGNVSAPSAELVVTVDTQAPALGALALAAGSDSGRSDSDGITNVTTPTVTGTAEAGATVALFDGARQLGTVMADANGAWSFKTAALSAGAHTLTATATDAAGNVAAPAALTVTIDSGAPAAPTALDLTAASDSGTSGTDNLTNVTTPTIAGKAEANASVALFDGTVLVGTGLADQDGNWQITVTQPLKDGAHGLTAQATDAAGNLSVKSTAIAVTIDTTPLAAPGAPDLDIGSDTGSLNTDNVTNAATPKFTGTASASTLIQLFDGDTLVGSATTTSTGAWSIVSAALADGAHTLTVRSVDPAGNLSAPSAPLVVTIDRAAPGAPGAPVLDAASDTGVSDADKLTKDATPTLTGSAEAGATVKLYDGATLVGSGVANADGVWTVTTGTLAAGVHNLTATATDAAGNVGPASAALAVTIDTVSTTPSALDLVTASDSGILITDNLTNVTTPTIAGKAEANATVSLFDGTVLVGTALADAGGNWQITVATPLKDGSHSLTAQATDLAGNVSVKSAALTVRIDATAQAAPTGLDLTTDSGVSATDNITNSATPTITGSAEAGITVQLYDGDTLVGSATSDASTGVWSIASAALADGAHTLTARTVDLAGNISAPSAPLVVTIDRAAPGAPGAPVLDAASDTGVSDADKLTKDATPTLTGSAEAGATVKLYDGTTLVGSGVANADGVWTVTTGTLAAGVHNLTATATDAAGNVGPASAALAVTIDTVSTTPSALDLVTASDSGILITDNLTNVTTPTIAGKAEANATVSLFDGTVLVGTALADAGGNWQITVATPLKDGSHSLTAQATDLAGNVSVKSAALTVRIDATAQAAPTGLDLTTDSGVSATDNITNSATPTITGSAEAGITVQLYDGDTLVGSATSDASTGVWSIASAALADGAHTLTARTVDLAGNISAPSAPLVVTIDRAAPGAPGAPVLDAASDTGVSDADKLTKDATPTLTGSAEAGATVKLYDGTTLVGSGVANADGVWTVTTGTLAAGVHNLTATATDAAGNVGPASAAVAVTIDTVSTTPSALDLVTASDSGILITDNLTNVTTPTIAGKAEANATVSLFDGTVLVGTALADAGGNWQITVATPLKDGSHSLTAQATDLAGNVSAKSAALTVRIDATAQAAPTGLDLTTDSGVSATDNITNSATPTITGSAEAGITVQLYDGDTLVGSATSDASTGVWSIASAALADGAHTLTARTVDLAGNISAPSAPLVVTIDRAAPGAPGAPVLDAASDTGVSDADKLTKDATPTLTGSAEAGATVKLYDGATLVGSGVANADGVWTVTTGTLAAGVHNLTATATDAAGNVGPASAAVAVTIDTASVAPSALDLVAASDSGSSSADNWTNVTRPTVAGKAEANAMVSLFDGTVLVGTGQADASGNWQITVAEPFNDGAHTLTAQATDLAGNVSAKSAALTVSIDATPLAEPTALDLLAAADTGVSNTDNLTNLATPTITGKASPGALIQLFDGDVLVGTIAADASTGAWSVASAALADGVHALTARAIDVAGNISAPSAPLMVTIDRKAPAIVAGPLLDPSSDTGRSNSDGITADTTPTVSGITEAGATVVLYDGTTAIGSAVADANGAWSITALARANGAHSLSYTATDAAGNVGASAALVVNVDLAAPAAPTVLDLATADDSGVSTTDNTTNVTLPAIAGKAEANAMVALYDGATVVGSTLADASGNWQIRVTEALADGVHTLTAKATDIAGNTSAASTALSVRVDTAAPLAPAALDLAVASDRGASTSDDLTNVATPTVTGTAEAGATVTLFDGEVAVGTALANNTGAWSIVSAKLGDGAHQLRATATDAAGNVSAASAELLVTIDTVAPSTPAAPTLAALSDTGRSDSDRITNDTTPTVGGTAEAGATVVLLDGTTQVGTAVADAGGAWSITASALAAGVHGLTVKATDTAGNVSAASAALSVTIDTTAPALPTVVDLLTSSDSGTVTTDNITNVATPTLSGKAEANASVGLYDGATLVGSGLADASGNWQITVAQALADGVHALTAQATDAAGNSTRGTAALSVTIDTTPAAAPSGLDLATLSDKGVSASDNLTNLATPQITGNAAAGAVVTLFDNGVKIGTATATAAGVWTVTTGALADGVHRLTASTVDVAGNLSLPSEALDVTIDTKLAVSAADLAAGSDSNIATDNVTSQSRLTFNGTAEIGSTVSVLDGTVLLGTVVADQNGAWTFTSATLADGVHNITTKATDAAGNSAAGAALSVTVDTLAPVLVDANAAGNFANAGAAANSTVGVTVGGADKGATYALTSNPGGLFAINATTGVITMPDSALLTGGAHDVTVQATDLAGNIGSGVFTIMANSAPTIAGLANTSFREDTSKLLSFTVGDSESAASALTLTGSADHARVVFGGTGADRTVTLVPDADWNGSTTVTITVRDPGGLTSSTSFVATVTPVDDLSRPQSDILATSERGAVAVSKASLLANDRDIDSAAPSSIIAVTSISGGTAALSGNNVVFTAGPAHGLGHYNYTVGDGAVGDVWVKLAPVANDGDYTFELQQMYVGYFGRAADKLGLSGKVGIISGKTITDAQSEAAALTDLGNEFVNSQEYKNIWGGMDHATMVKTVYWNLFGRTVEATGLSYWVGLLDGGQQTAASLVWSIARGAQNTDKMTADNKTYVAQYFTDQMTSAQNSKYLNGASQGMLDFLQSVNASDSSVISGAERTAAQIYAETGVLRTGGAAMASRHVADDGDALTVHGTAAADQFVLGGQARLTVLDFAGADGDRLLLSHTLNGLDFASAADVLARSHVEGGDTVIDLGLGQTVTLVGVNALNAGDITLAG